MQMDGKRLIFSVPVCFFYLWGNLLTAEKENNIITMLYNNVTEEMK